MKVIFHFFLILSNLFDILSATYRGVNVCGVKDEEVENWELFNKVLQSYTRINSSALGNSTQLIHEVKQILVEHFKNMK